MVNPVSDETFMVLCLKHLASRNIKPDFEQLAVHLECTPKSAYHRHYRLMRNIPALRDSTDASVAGPSKVPKTPKAPKAPKRRRGWAGRPKAYPTDAVEDDDDDAGPSTKRVKGDGEDMNKAVDKGKGKVKEEVIVDELDDAYIEEEAERAFQAYIVESDDEKTVEE